jgi:Zn finger protein HypA/HybF involved in hydrogenase expression
MSDYPMLTIEQRKVAGLCYFCGEDAKTSHETVNGKSDDHKVCPSCFQDHQSAIYGSRARIAQFEKITSGW